MPDHAQPRQGAESGVAPAGVGGPICVFGAGAIGGLLAARLRAAGEQVCVVARGAQLDAIRERGLSVRGGGMDCDVRLEASDDAGSLGVQSAVIVTVKAHGLASVAMQIAPLLGPSTAVYFLLNGIPWWFTHRMRDWSGDPILSGLDPEGRLSDTVGLKRTLGGVVFAAAEIASPGVIAVTSARQRIVLGELDGSLSQRVGSMSHTLAAAGLQAQVTGTLADEVWTKLMANISSGPLCLLTQRSVSDVFRDAWGEQLARRLLSEVADIASAYGCAPDTDFEGFIQRGKSLHHRPSILQDLAQGKTLEFSALYEAPLALARRATVAVPTLDMIVSLARLRAGLSATS